MIEYKLLEQLEDAGFPFTTTQRDAASLYRHQEGVPISILSEIIEACGMQFYAVVRKEMDSFPTKKGEEWAAVRDRGDRGVFGKTPEEAVAKLWLELNK